MTFNPPRTIRVLGQKVKVRLLKDINRELEPEDHDHSKGDRVGHADLRAGVIHVSTGQSADQVADTYLHEAMHIMLMMVGHDDEEAVFRFTPVLLDFLRSNPRFVEYVMQKRLVSW